ncbi:MAG: DUF4011 domain-containing protein [Bacilli bacterium]|nr:DUF4011 domain-containing protein [Bacilli bacterium]
MDEIQLRISVEMGRTFSFLEYHSDALVKASDPSIFTTPFSFLRKIEISNTGDEDIVGAKLAIEFSNPIFSCEEFPLPGIPGRQDISLNPLPAISVDKQKLYELTESDVCEITIKIISSDGSLLLSSQRSTKLLPISMPSDDPEARDVLLSKYVITDFPEMSLIHHMAIEENLGRPLIGYQNTRYDGSIDKDAIIHEVECIYKALHKYGITYANPPHSSELYQKIRLPMTVLKDRLGTCLDLAILCCACMSEIGLRSILILEKGHAYSGFFLDEKTQYVPLEKNVNVVLNQVTGAKKDVAVFETTTLSSDSNASFASALEIGTSHLKEHPAGFKAIDIDFCHNGAYKPIPVAKEDASIDFDIEPAKISEVALTSIRDYQFRPINSGEEQNRFVTWEKKLLDLSASNKLVNFKIAKNSANCISMPKQDGKSVYDYLRFSDKGSFKIRFIQGNEKEALTVSQESLDDLRKSNVLLVEGSPTNLKKLIRASNSSKEETGSPTLYLALGYIENTKLSIKAPLLLLPVSITKDRLGDDFTAEYDFDDLMLNKTFFEYCKLKTGVDYSSVYGLSGNDEFHDIVNTIRQMTTDAIAIDDESFFFANFTFSHYVMWTDIHNRRDELKANPVVASLLKNESEIVNSEDEIPEDLDLLDDMSTFAAPLPYDSTQLRAIVEAGKGNSFILDGPPGTGKSQTIVNMIVNAFYHGKTVLFIAEKMAALDVVRTRLDKLGLSRFALELYSNKANKASVFNQLGESLNTGAQTSAGDFEGHCLQIKTRKKELSQELKKLHRKNGLYYSLYEAFNNRLLSNDAAGLISLNEEYAQKYDGQKDVAIRSAFADIHSLADSIPNFDSSLLRLLRIRKFDYTDQTDLPKQYEKLSAALKELKAAYEAFGETANVPADPSRKLLEQIIEIYGLALHGNIRGEALVETGIFANDTLNEEALKLLLELGALQEKYASCFKPEAFLAFNAKETSAFVASNKGLFGKGKVKKRFAQELEPHQVAGVKVDFDKQCEFVEAAKGFQNTYENASLRAKDLASFFGYDILKEGKFDGIAEKIQTYKDTAALFHLIETYDNGEQLPQKLIRFMTIIAGKAQFAATKLQVEELGKRYEDYKKVEADILAIYPFDVEGLSANGFIALVGSFLEECLHPENAKPIASAAQITVRCDALRENGLDELVDKLLRAEINVDEMDDAFENALDNAFIRLYFRDPYYNQFSSALYESKIQSYQDLIQEYNTLAVAEVTAKVTKDFINPKIDHKASTPIGALRKLVASGGRGITIRNALQKYEAYFRSYFPVFLMSPLSAAQYLDVDSKKFDIIIFDEASQIPTSEAVGPIARGNALIVAGDPQQMPPTNYFSVSLNSDDVDDAGLEEFQDSESLLDDCISIGMPRIRLCYHYRSKHQSLIEFSNQNFYRGDLFTFPSFDTLTSHISFKEINVPEKSSNALSKEEINEVLQTLKALLTSPKDKTKSVGIIVFNIKQQAKLQDEIDRFFDKNKDLAAVASAWEDPLFVKNLENVQGDERDIIILCVGFSKGASGKAEIRGPLILDKGERRLNVAASRAKERMIVISTIRAADIDAAKAKNAGARYLKNFLAYAEAASAAEFEVEEPDPNIASFIQRDLMRRGFDSDLNVGTSGFKIDLAIKKPGSSEYALGIVLDAQEGKESMSTRDRFYVSAIMLGALKWKIIHVFTLDYLRFPPSTIDTIIASIDMTESTEVESSFVAPTMVDANKDFDYKIVDYVRYKPTFMLNPAKYESGLYYPRLANEMKSMVQIESPIAATLLKERVKELLNNTSKRNLDAIIETQLNFFADSLAKTVDAQNETFYWFRNGKEGQLLPYRRGDRDVYCIPKEELVFLMNRIIEAQSKIDREDLIRLTAGMVGATLTKKAREKIEYSLDWAIKLKLLRRGYVEHYESE